MGLLRTGLKTAFPVTRLGAALFAWRHRRDILGWAAFVRNAVPDLVTGKSADVVIEARLRARLTGDHRTRGVDGLRIDVADGVATLTGLVPVEAHDAAVAIATNTTGVARVRDELEDLGSRRGGRR